MYERGPILIKQVIRTKPYQQVCFGVNILFFVNFTEIMWLLFSVSHCLLLQTSVKLLCGKPLVQQPLTLEGVSVECLLRYFSLFLLLLVFPTVFLVLYILYIPFTTIQHSHLNISTRHLLAPESRLVKTLIRFEMHVGGGPGTPGIRVISKACNIFC